MIKAKITTAAAPTPTFSVGDKVTIDANETLEHGSTGTILSDRFNDGQHFEVRLQDGHTEFFQAGELVKEKRSWTKLDCAKAEKEYAFKGMMEHMESMRLTLERAAAEIARYEKQMEEAEACQLGLTKGSTADVYGWALDELANRVRNLNANDAVRNASIYASKAAQVMILESL